MHIPFLAWTIGPYWSIDLLYGISLFVCATRRELDTHVRRLLTAQLIAVTCFIIFPLRFTFQRPAAESFFGPMFDLLAAFDKPFNQAPSLHVALLIILWVLYARHLPRAWQWLLHAWFALICASVLATYQHHFVDVPTGIVLGWLCVWLWPDEHASPLRFALLTRDRRRLQLGSYYAGGAVLVAALAVLIGGWGWWLLWPSVALLMVAGIYWFIGEQGFQKRERGCLSQAARWLMAPYLAGAWINSRLWTWKHFAPILIADGVWLGRAPRRHELSQTRFKALVDLSAEFSIDPQDRGYVCIPVLDLTLPSAAQLTAAAQAIERLRHGGPLLAFCALGYSRSAAAIATWLAHSGRCASADQAVALLRRHRPEVVIDDALLTIIAAAARSPGV